MRLIAAIVSLGVLILPRPARAEVQVAMHDGVVSVTAKDATVRQILAEWARIGQTTIVNLDGISGGPTSLQLIDMPEEQALDIILRSVSGYVTAPRHEPAANRSRFDRILIMPTSAPATTAAARTTAAPQTPPQPRPQQAPADADDDQPVPNAPPPAPPLAQRPPAPGPRTFPAPVNPAQPPASAAGDPPNAESGGTPTPYNSSTPSAPNGVAVPGMIVQQPQQPGQQPRQP
jgi:hypothetical protein